MRTLTIKVPGLQDLKDAVATGRDAAALARKNHRLGRAVRLAEKSEKIINDLVKEEV